METKKERKIKIFLASSYELKDDRESFGSLVLHLDYVYRNYGIRFELIEWEDFDASFTDRRKQDEYNDELKKCDVFVALFYTKAGEWTIEEFRKAQDFGKKSYVFMRKGGEETTELRNLKGELKKIKDVDEENYGDGNDLKLAFLRDILTDLELPRVEISLTRSRLIMDGLHIAKAGRTDSKEIRESNNKLHKKRWNEKRGKTIIYLVTSSKSFGKIEYDNLCNLIRFYNSCGLEIDLIEDDEEISRKESLETEKKLRKCHIFLMLLYDKKNAECTMTVFQNATDIYNEIKGEFPYIYPYVKKGENRGGEIDKEIYKKFQHNCCIFTEPENLKVTFMRQLMLLGPKFKLEWRIVDGKVMIGDTVLIDLSKTSFMSINDKFQLLTQLADKTEELINYLRENEKRARAKTEKNELGKRIEDNQIKLKELQKQRSEIQESQGSWLETTQYIAVIPQKYRTENIDQVQLLYNFGQVREANEVLNFKKIIKRAKNCENKKNGRDDVIKCIMELTLKARTVMDDKSIGDMSARRKEACKMYEAALTYADAEKIGYEKSARANIWCDYGMLLFKANRSEECIEPFKNASKCADGAEKAHILCLLGRAYTKIEEPGSQREAVHAFYASLMLIIGRLSSQEEVNDNVVESKVLEIIKSIGDWNKGNEVELAETIHYFGNLLYAEKLYDNAIECYNKVLEIRQEIAKGNSIYEYKVAETYNNLGNSCDMKRDFNGAIGWYEKALIINKKLSKKQPKLYKRKLADNYYNRGLCFSKCPEKIESAVNDYEMARELFQKLSDYDPEVYRPKLSNVLASFVNLRTQQGQKDESEKMYKEAIGLLASSLKLELQIEKDKKNGQNGSNNASKDEAVKRRYNDIIKVLEKLSELHNKDDISLSFAEIVTVYVLKSDFKKSNELIEEIKGSIQYKSRLLSCWSEIEKLEILSDEQKKYIEKKREELK